MGKSTKEHDPLKELEKIFFPVYKQEAPDDYTCSSWLSHEIFVQPRGLSKPHKVNVCSADYGLVSNRELFTPILEELMKIYPELEARVIMRDYAQFYVDLHFKGKPLRGATKKDILYPRLRINNSYNGAVKYSFYMGLWRLICGNGAMAPVEGSLKSGTFMHTPQLADGAAVETLMSKVTTFIEKSKEIVRGYDPLIEHTLSEAAAIERIDEVKKMTDFPTTLVEHAAARLSYEASQLRQPINDYLVYNAMNFALYNSGQSEMPEHKKDKQDSKVLNYLLADNE
jgi:hypothetical protein